MEVKLQNIKRYLGVGIGVMAVGILLFTGGCGMTRTKDPLKTYRTRRDLEQSSEPRGTVSKKRSEHIFVIQKHEASHLHYDFRLEIGGVLKSWAVPKRPSSDPKIKRLAVETDDHPLAYATFSGTIPEGSYGAGIVTIWDTGTYTNIKKDTQGKDVAMRQCLKKGTIEIELKGKKLKGNYALVRMNGAQKNHWLLIKMRT
jgi:bifunctional non-homologous end joining protein LigD